jgi:hypothetical protein
MVLFGILVFSQRTFMRGKACFDSVLYFINVLFPGSGVVNQVLLGFNIRGLSGILFLVFLPNEV